MVIVDYVGEASRKIGNLLKGHYAVAKITSRQNVFVIVLMSLVTRMCFIY